MLYRGLSRALNHLAEHEDTASEIREAVPRGGSNVNNA